MNLFDFDILSREEYKALVAALLSVAGSTAEVS